MLKMLKMLGMAKEASPPEASKIKQNPYEMGMTAAKNGLDHWCNPFSEPSGSPESFKKWSGGWCQGKQLLHIAAADDKQNRINHEANEKDAKTNAR